MNLKKITISIVFSCAILFLLLCDNFFIAYAFEFDSEEYNSVLSEYDTSFTDTLDEDSRAVLESFGLLDFDYGKILNFSVNDMFEYISATFKEKSVQPLKAASIIFIIICISSFFQSVKETENNSEFSSLFSSLSAVIIALLLIAQLKETVALSYFTISLCADFIYAFIPTFCTVTAASGCAVTAATTSGILLAFAQIINYISNNIFVPLANSFLALSICSGIRSEFNLQSLIQTLKTLITTAISVCATAFVSVLSLKTAVSSRADAVGIRSIRFAINSVVPVIGGAVSEGLLSIQAYSSLIKTGIGAVGIISVAVLFLPSIIAVIMWKTVLSLCRIVSDVFDDSSVKTILEAFINALIIINVILILTMVTTIISIGVLIAARGNV